MKIGVSTSILAHLLAVGMGVVSLSAPRPMVVADVEALPVDIVPIESLTRTIAGEANADRAELPATTPTTRPQTVDNAENIGDANSDKPSNAEPVTNAPPVEKTREAAAEPEPEVEDKPQPVETPELAREAEPKQDVALLTKPAEPEEKVAEAEESFQAPERVIVPKQRPSDTKPETAKTNERKKADEAAKKKAEKDKASDDEIAALLNKEDASAGGAKRSTKKEALGAKKSNNAVKLSQSEVDALRGQIQGCWNVVGLAGLDNADKLRARVEFRLSPDGTIDGRPTVEASGGDSRTNRTFAGSAKRAVMGCAPYTLPADKYEDWADVVVNFSLKDML